MKNYYLLFFLFCSLVVNAQNKYDYVWKTGYGDGDFKKYLNSSILNFNNDTLIIKADSIRVSTAFANAGICDKNGNLLCYTGGYWLEDTKADVIPGSMNLINHTDSSLIKIIEKDGVFGGVQYILMLPTPEKEDKEFYVFNFASDTLNHNVDDFAYTKVTYDSTHFKVEEKCSEVTKGKSFYSAYLTACRHGNGRDWWIFANEYGNKFGHLFLFTKDGIVQDNEILLEGNIIDTINEGVACFTNDGEKLAIYSFENGLWLYDFNRCSGEIKNLQTIQIKGETKKIYPNYPRGMANSPDSRYLYISKAIYLYQFDLFAKDIASSKYLLAEIDSTKDTFGIFTVAFSNLQLAPNNKIYMSNSGGLDYLHSIENPNEKGAAANFTRRSVKLPTYQAWCLPNYPNFRLGAAKGSLCDTITGMPYEKEVVLLFPNPYVSGDNLNLQYNGKASAEFILYDITGRLVYRKQLQQTSESQYLQLPLFPIGNYVWKVGSTVGKLQIY